MEEEMLDQGNQTEPASMDDVEFILPDDYVEEEETEEVEVEDAETEDTEETEEEVEEESEETEETTDALEDLEIKYLKETKKLSDIPRDELKALVQKGMNEPRLQEKISDALQEKSDIEEVAKMFDMDTEQLMDALKQQYYTKIAEDQKRNINDVKKEYESNKKDRQTKMVEKFVEKYPDVDHENLDKEITEAVKNGEDLTNAYEAHNKNKEFAEKDKHIGELNDKIADLEKQIKTLEQNKATKKRGVVKRVNGSDDTQDDFVLGLLGK